MILKSSN